MDFCDSYEKAHREHKHRQTERVDHHDRAVELLDDTEITGCMLFTERSAMIFKWLLKHQVG